MISTLSVFISLSRKRDKKEVYAAAWRYESENKIKIKTKTKIKKKFKIEKKIKGINHDNRETIMVHMPNTTYLIPKI